MLVALQKDLFWVPAAQDGSNLISLYGVLFYNVLARPPPNTQRLFVIIPDSNFGT